MAAVSPTNLGNQPTYRQVSWLDLVMRSWGTEWRAPDHGVYEFTGKRKFDSTDQGNTGIYNGGIPPQS